VSFTTITPASPGSAGASAKPAGPQPAAAQPGAAQPASAQPGASSPEADTIAPNTIIDETTTAIMPPGYTETVTTQEDGTVTTVIANPAGAPVETTITTATMSGPGAAETGPSVNVWA
jgi:hypothetical protein